MLENYYGTPDGVIHQKHVEKIQTYDKKYIEERYSRLGEKLNYLAWLRLGIISEISGIHPPASIMDVGYGSGAFLKAAQEAGYKCYGYDINGCEIPEGCNFCDPSSRVFDIITMFDVFEHFEKLDIIRKWHTHWMVISVPNCKSYNDEWFENWKHRRPNEHLHHFNRNSLKNYMLESRYKEVWSGNPEDLIRKDKEGANILTSIFKRI